MSEPQNLFWSMSEFNKGYDMVCESSYMDFTFLFHLFFLVLAILRLNKQKLRNERDMCGLKGIVIQSYQQQNFNLFPNAQQYF